MDAGLLILIAVLGLAAARITALIVVDTITEPFRHWIWLRFPPEGDEYEFYRRMDSHEQPLDVGVYPDLERKSTKIGTLISCYHCVGVWVAAFAFAAWFFLRDITEPVIIVAAVAQLSDVGFKIVRE